MSDSQSAALLAHIVSQTQNNVQFLVQQNFMSQADADAVLARLPGSSASPITIVSQMTTMTISSPDTSRRGVPPPPAARPVRARALWAYNEDGQLTDLSFSAGDIIEIVAETNEDWWTGKARGRQGLFPSNHVEKISDGAPAPSPAPMSAPAAPAYGNNSAYVNTPAYGNSAPAYGGNAPSYNNAPSYVNNAPVYRGPGQGRGPGQAPYGMPMAPSGPMPEKAPYRPFGAAYHGNDMPPPQQGGITNSVGLAQAPPPEPKKSKFGGLGTTMANSAAGGVGFGAGAAVGSGIINAIF